MMSLKTSLTMKKHVLGPLQDLTGRSTGQVVDVALDFSARVVHGVQDRVDGGVVDGLGLAVQVGLVLARIAVLDLLVPVAEIGLDVQDGVRVAQLLHDVLQGVAVDLLDVLVVVGWLS